MLDRVKLALRITTATFDGEVTGLIEAAIADLHRVGIVVDTTDPLIERAVILYAKAHFGYSDQSDKYRQAYAYLQCVLSLDGEHNGVGG